MKKLPKKKNGLSYLKLFKQSLALSFSLFLFGSQGSYASNIQGDPGFNTNVTPNGSNIFDITGGIQSGNANILHFFNFILSQGDTANLIFGQNSKYVGLVDTQIVINGILNAMKNGTIGGDVVFVSPEGMLVGQSGIMNMGSLQLITPNSSSYNDVIAKGSTVRLSDIDSLSSNSTTSQTEIDGKIFANGAININDANSVTLGANSDIVSGFNANGFAKTISGDLSDIVNDDGIVDSQYMTGENGSIQIVSKNIDSANLFSRNSTIQSTGDVSVKTANTTGTQIRLTSKIDAGGDVTIGNYSATSPTEGTTTIVDLRNEVNAGGNISLNGNEVSIGNNANLNASGGSVNATTSSSLILNSNVTADSGINIDTGEFEQGTNSAITNNSSGDINIDASMITQNEGASITNNGQDSNIIISSVGTANLEKVSLTNAQGEDNTVSISSGNLVLNDTINSNKNINIDARTITQNGSGYTALQAGSDVILNTRYGGIGSSSQALNMSAGGEIVLDTMGNGGAYIHGTGDNDLTIAAGNNLTEFSATSENGINVTGNIVSNGDVNLEAATGINQSSGTNIDSYSGSVNLTNTASGDITTGNINSYGSNGNVTVSNNAADGSVNLGGLINSQNGNVKVDAQQNITQSGSNKTIQASGNVELNATSGDIGTEEQRVVVSTDGDVTANAGAALNIEGQDTNIDLSKVSAGTDYNLGTTGEGELLLNGEFSNENGGIKLETENTLNIQNNISAAGDITLTTSKGVNQSEGTQITSGTGNAQSGNITITNTGEGGIVINSAIANKGGVTVSNTETATGDVSVGGISATGGDINIQNSSESGNIILTDSMQTDSNIELTAANSILQNSDFGGVSLNAQNNINLTATSGSVGTNDDFIQLAAGNIVNAAGADVYLKSPNADLKTGIITATNSVNLDTTGNTILNDLISATDVTITATGNITQNTADASQQTISADGNLSLTSTGGNIGDYSQDEAKSVVFSAGGELSANAQSGSVAINGVDTSIDTANINAGQNIDIATTNTGKITVSNQQNVTGHINLNSAENIELNQAISATEDITLTAKGDVVQSESLSQTALSSGADINITAANAGTADKAIIVDAQGAVNLGTEDNHAGNIYLEDNTGDFSIGQMFADENLSLKAQGNIVQSDNSVVGITSSGKVTVSSEQGNIGSQDSSLKLNITGGDSSFNVTNSQNVYVESPNSSLNTGDINAAGSVNIATTESGGVNLGGLISANDITIHAIDSIVQNPANTNKTLETTGNLTLISDNGSIGDSSESGSAIRFSIGESGTLAAEAQEGSVFLNGIDTDINTGTILAKDNIDLTTTNSGTITVSSSLNAEGHITLDSAESLTLNGDLSAGDYIDLAANSGDVNLNHVLTAENDISISASGNILQDLSQSGSTINSGADVNLTAGSSIGSSQQSIIINADGTVNAQAGSAAVPVPGGVYLTSAGKTINTGTISATDAVKINTTGTGNNINLTNKITGKDVNLQTEGSITQNIAQGGPDRSIDASGNLILSAGESIGQTGNAVDFSADGNLSAIATNGSVVLNGIDTDINTQSISAGTDIDLKTTIVDDSTKGNITVQNALNSANGYISLDSAKALEINHDISAGKYVNLAANGGIVQNEANSITSGTNAQSGTADSYIHVSNKGGGDITLNSVNAKGEVTINNSGASSESGNITIGTINSQESTVSVENTAAGNIVVNNTVSAAGDISVSSEGDIIHSGTGLALDSGNNITLSGTNIGSNDKHLSLNAEGTVGADGTNIYLESTDKDLNISGINKNAQQADGNISLSATGNGNVHFEGVVKGGNITVNSALGITQESSLEKAIEASSNLVLNAQNGSIGSADASSGGAIDFSSGGTIKADATGAVVLNGIDTDIVTDTINAGTDIDLTTTNSGSITVNNTLTTTNGYISLNSAESLDISQNIDSSDYLKLNAQNGDLNISADISSDTYTDIAAANGSISVNADINSETYTNLNAANGNVGLNSDITAGTYVNIEANGDITQTNGTITANGADSNSNGLSVTSNGGNITITKAAAQNGSVSIKANKTEIKHPAIPGDEETPEVPEYTETIAGDINAGGISAQGSVTIQNDAEDKNVNLTGLISSADNIQITSEGNITQSTNDTTLQADGNVILDAAGNVGANTNSVLINADGTVKADGENIYLGSKDSNLNIAGINSADSSADGIVQVTTETGNINLSGLINGGNISLSSAQGITQSSSISKAIDGQNVSLISNNGSIGSTGNEIDINIRENGKVDASSSDSIYLNSPEGTLTTGEITAQNTVDITSSDALNMSGLIQANDVNLTAVNNITQSSNLEKSIQAANVRLESTSGSIGEPAEGETPANAIDFSATGTLEAHADNGSVVLNGVNTSINTSSVTAGDNIDISTTGEGSNITVSNELNAGGYINLNSAEGLILEHNLTATDYVSLAAQKDILLDSLITAGTDIDITAGGSITQEATNNNIVLNAQNNINLAAGGDIGLSSKSILLNAGNTVGAQGQNIYLSSPNKDLTLSTVTAADNGSVNITTTGSGNLHLTGLVKGANVNLESAQNITQDSSLNKSIEAKEKLVLNAQNGDIGEAKNADTPANAIDFSAGSVEAHADSGSVVLNGVESDINTGSISAQNNIDLTTTTGGKITVASPGLSTTNGYININSADDLVLNYDITAANNSVSLGSQNGNITLNSTVTAGTDINIDTNGNIIQQTTDTALNAANDINIINAANAGSAENSILVNAGAEVNANGQNLYLEDNTGNFVIGEITSANDLKLTAEGNLVQSDYSQTGVTAGGNADLISNTGSIGSSSESINTAVEGLVNATAQNGSAYLASAGDFNAGNISVQNIAQINSQTNISLNGVINANQIDLQAQNNITQTTDGAALQTTGGNINLTSTNGNIGTPNGQAIGFTTQGSGTVYASAQNADGDENGGSVVLKGVDSDINTSTIDAQKDIDLTTTGSGNITVYDDLTAGGYISLDSANALNIDKNLTAQQNIDLTANNGDITLGAVLDAGTDINLESSGSVTQTVNDTVLNAGEDISIIAADTVGTDGASILLNAGGNVNATGTNIYLTSPDADFNTGDINATAQNGVVDLNTTGSGSINTNGKIDGSQIAINSAQDVNINSNISAQNGLSVTAQNGITQISGTTVSNSNNDLTITANDGDMTLSGAVQNTNGNVNLVNESTGNASMTVGSVTSGANTTIRHEGNGLLTVNGTINNNGNSQILSNNDGDLAGLAIRGTINNNKGSLNIQSHGAQGTQISGTINNDFVNDSSGAHSDITIHNHNGSLNITSNKIDNGKTNGSQNTISITNDGNGGLNITSDITNYGNLSVTNNDGSMSLSGALTAELGSTNTFTNGADNDLTINSDIENKGTTLTFNNTGSGNLILGKDAIITVYSVLDNQNVYTGILNLNNSGTAGSLQINGQINGLAQAPDGQINIQNTATGANSGISFGDNAAINANNNTVLITNSGAQGIQAGNGVSITSDKDTTLTNTAGGINFGTDAVLSGSNLSVTNSNSGAITFGNNAKLDAVNDLTVSNTADGGVEFGDNAAINAAGKTEISAAAGGLSIGNQSSLSGSQVSLSNNGSGSLSIGDSSSINASSQNISITNKGSEGITIGDSSDITASGSATISGNGGIDIGAQSEIEAAGIDISNTGSGGLSIGGGSTVTSTANDILIKNEGTDILSIGNSTGITSAGSVNVSSNAGMMLGEQNTISGTGVSISNIGSGGVSVGAGSNISSSKDMSITNEGSDGIQTGDGTTISADNNITISGTEGGIGFGESSSVSAGNNLDITSSVSGGISVGSNTTLEAGEKLSIQNTGNNIDLNGRLSAKDISISAQNSNLNIAHNRQDGNISADNKTEIVVTNGSINNTAPTPEAQGSNKGIVSGEGGIDLTVTGGSIGVLDETLNDIVTNGFASLDPTNAINVDTTGTINASADGDINLRADDNMNVGTLSAKDMLLTSVNGTLNADDITANNIYLYAGGTNGAINVENLTSTGKLSSESTLNTTINSDSALNIDSMLSKNGSIKINSDGNTYINEIAANDDITVNVEDEKLTITTLGRVERDPSVVPKTVNLTVKDVNGQGTQYRPGMSYDQINNVGPNSKLDIYHAYVQDKVTLKADTITAQVYDISDGSVSGQKRVDANGKEATGFHNANKNGELLDFDIQGANYSQPDVGSDPHNAFYTPDENDKHALNVHLTIGDSVDGAQFGANFEKLYSDYAFIDTVGSDSEAFSNINVESGIIGEKAIFRNNKYRVDIDNTSHSQDYPINKHYDDEPYISVNNNTSFNLGMNEEVKIDIKPNNPADEAGDMINKNDPNKQFNVPNINYLTQEPKTNDDENKITNSEHSTAVRNISWVIRNTDNEILGASEQSQPNPTIKSLVAISQEGIMVEADTNKHTGLKKDKILHIQMKKGDASFNIDGIVENTKDGIAQIKFINIDKLTQNIMTMWCMETENL